MYAGPALTGDLTLLATHCHLVRASCVKSRFVDRRTYRCLCWCWVGLSLAGLGSRLMVRVVDLRALSSTRIADRRVLACRCRFTVFRDVYLGRDRFDNTLSTPHRTPSAWKADVSTSPFLNVKFDSSSTKMTFMSSHTCLMAMLTSAN